MILRPAMRFCPFCAQENPDDARECVHCGKRLPALRQPPARPAPASPRPPAVRPAPPRPAPRAPSLVPPTQAPSLQPSAFAPTAAPGTLPPVKPHPPSNGPAHAPKSSPADATLKPIGDGDDTRENTGATAAPALHLPSAPTGTLLGIPAQEIPSSTLPALESERDSGRRTTKPLSLANLAREARRQPGFDEDAQTEVQAPATVVDDGPTSRNVRLDVDEEAQTMARPAPRSRPLESMTTTPPMGVSTRRATPAAGIPGRRPTPPAGLPTRPTSFPSASSMPTRPTSLPPEPLPPPPTVGNDAGSFPQLDMGPTPAIPTLALPLMPAHPKSGSIVDAVKYLPPLARAIWARKKAQDAIRTLLHGDQRLLDSVLRDLGRVAREEEVVAPAIAEEMRRVKEQEDKRRAAEQQFAEAESGMKKEDERWHFDEGERGSELARREAEIKVIDEDLRQRAEERRAHDAERAKVDVQIRAAEKRAAAADAKAAKAEATPPEKGGGPNSAANARAEAAEARKDATALIPARDAARAAAEKLDEPIASLTKQITDARATLQQKRRELTEARAAHEQTLKELQATRERAAAERDTAERELTQRFVTAGTILNLNRVEHPKLQPLFGRVDELKSGVNAREAAIVRLESERRVYDRAAVQKGLLTVGIALGTVVLLAIILIVFIAR